MKREKGQHPVDKLATLLGAMQDANLIDHRKANKLSFLIAPGRVRPMGLVAARMSINPFELMLLSAAVLSGASYVFGGKLPNSIYAVLPEWAVRLWGITLVLGSLASAVGGLSRKFLDKSLALYQFGWGLLGTACVVYGVAIFLLFGTSGTMTGLMTTFFALAAWVRVVQVQQFFNLAEMLRKVRIAEAAADREGVDNDRTGG